MVSDPVRAFVRRHPNVRYATRRIRARLPQVLGGIDPERIPPRVRSFPLALPRCAGRIPLGPDSVTVTVPGDLWVPRRLEQEGVAGYEPRAVACFLAVLEHAQPGAVLDIGANIGLYALLAAARSRRRVYAFEPTPEVADAARAIAKDNGLRVRVEEVALSNHTGTGLLRLSATSEVSNSLAAGFRPELSRIPIQVHTASRWRERDNIVPAVLKVDTGPTAPDVIAGALEVMRRFRPWILCEVLPGHGIEERLMALLEPLHYSWHRVEGDPPHPPQALLTDHSFRSDAPVWLFAPELPGTAFWEAVRLWDTAVQACGSRAR